MKPYILLFAFTLMAPAVFSQNTEKTMKNILAAYEFKTQYTTIDNLEIAYIKEGQGDITLLFLHGLSSNSDAWAKNIKVLRNQYTCIAIDLPGFGKSSKVKAPYTPSFFAGVTHEFIQKHALKNVILIGHSMGGQASIKLAATYPKAIQKLILIAPAGLEEFSGKHADALKSTYTKEMVMNTTDEQIEKNYRLNFFKMPDDAAKMIADRKQRKYASDFNAHCEAIIKSISGMLDEPVVHTLGNIPHETLVIFGENDMLIPNQYLHPDLTTVKVGDIALKKIKNARLKILKEVGHFVQFEKPDAVNTLIREFAGR